MLTRFATRATFVAYTNFVSWTQKLFLKISRDRAARNNVAAFCHGRATSQDTLLCARLYVHQRSLSPCSVELLEMSEESSARKARWNTVINNTLDVASCSSVDVSPASTLKKRPKRSMNEGRFLVRVAGDINVLATPLLLEALQR